MEGDRWTYWRGVACAVVVVGVVGPVAASGTVTAAADGNEAPLAEAGLDQTVSLNDTVHLDATGSRDPDGSIETYEWEIESPGGVMFDPDCGSCAHTQFRVRTTGTYNVTVRVTDDDGAVRSDTLRVTVESVESPSVTLSGPREVDADENVTFEAAANAGDGDHAEVWWLVNDSRVSRESVDGEAATVTLTHAFAEGGTYELTARVTSRFGRTATATRLVEVEPVVNVRTTTGEWDAYGSGSGCPDVEMADKCDKKEYVINPNNHSEVILVDITGDGYASYKGYEFDVTEGRETMYEEFNPGAGGIHHDSNVTAAVHINKANALAFEKKYGTKPGGDNSDSVGNTDATSGGKLSDSDSSDSSDRSTDPSTDIPFIHSGSLDSESSDNGGTTGGGPIGPSGPPGDW